MTDFSFITSHHERKMVESAFKAISIAEKWEFLKTFKPNANEGFMFTSNETAEEIMTCVNEAYNGGHSGASMAWTMRIMQLIARKGVDGLAVRLNTN